MKNAYKKCKDENYKSGNKPNQSLFYDDSFNETQDLLGNSDSDFEVAVKRNKNSKKRKHDDSSDNDEYYEDFKNEVKAKKSKAQEPKKTAKPKTFQQQQCNA